MIQSRFRATQPNNTITPASHFSTTIDERKTQVKVTSKYQNHKQIYNAKMNKRSILAGNVTLNAYLGFPGSSLYESTVA